MTPLLAERPTIEASSTRSFEAVYRTHVRDVYGFALSMLGNAEDAEDVAQTTFLNAYRALQRGEEVRNLRAWLLAIAHNVCRQRFRTAARRPQEVELDPEAAEAFRDEDAPSAQDIRAAMAQLSFNQRTVLVLREIEGLSYEEISHAMDISLSAVETLLFRARQALREQLDAADNDLGCDSVQRLISLQLDGKLSRQDKGLLRAHLRSCAECARFARSQRARKRVMPSLIAVPLPLGLTGGFSAGGAGVGASFGAGLASAKVAALAVSAVLVGAGALVESGVVPAPAGIARDGKEQRIEAALDGLSHAPPNLSALPSVAGGGRALPAKATKPKANVNATKSAAQGAGKKPGGKKAGAPAAAGGQTVSSGGGSGSYGGGSGSSAAGGGSQGSVGSGGLAGVAGGVVPTPPAAPSVGGAVGDVTEAIDEAKSNLPALPVSPPVEAPSLPPVSVPGIGSLP